MQFIADLLKQGLNHIRARALRPETLASVRETAESLAEVREATRQAHRREGRPTAVADVANDRQEADIAALTRQMERLMLYRHLCVRQGIASVRLVSREATACDLVCAAALLQGSVDGDVAATEDVAAEWTVELVQTMRATLEKSASAKTDGSFAVSVSLRLLRMARGFTRVAVSAEDISAHRRRHESGATQGGGAGATPPASSGGGESSQVKKQSSKQPNSNRNNMAFYQSAAGLTHSPQVTGFTPQEAAGALTLATGTDARPLAGAELRFRIWAEAIRHGKAAADLLPDEPRAADLVHRPPFVRGFKTLEAARKGNLPSIDPTLRAAVDTLAAEVTRRGQAFWSPIASFMIKEGYRAIKDAALERAIAEGKVIRDAERGTGGQPVIRRVDPKSGRGSNTADPDDDAPPRISELYPDLPPAWNISRKLVDTYELFKPNGEPQYVVVLTDLRGRPLHLSKEFESPASALRSGMFLGRNEVVIGPAELHGMCDATVMAPAPNMDAAQVAILERVHAPARRLRDALTSFVAIVRPPPDSPGPAERRANARLLAELIAAVRNV
jgi:hypothetical protein